CSCEVPHIAALWLTRCAKLAALAALVETLAPTRCNHDATDAGMRNSITGISGCCACAASGHAAAPPSSAAKSFRRAMWLAMLPLRVGVIHKGGMIPRFHRAVCD